MARRLDFSDDNAILKSEVRSVVWSMLGIISGGVTMMAGRCRANDGKGSFCAYAYFGCGPDACLARR